MLPLLLLAPPPLSPWVEPWAVLGAAGPDFEQTLYVRRETLSDPERQRDGAILGQYLRTKRLGILRLSRRTFAEGGETLVRLRTDWTPDGGLPLLQECVVTPAGELRRQTDRLGKGFATTVRRADGGFDVSVDDARGRRVFEYTPQDVGALDARFRPLKDSATWRRFDPFGPAEIPGAARRLGRFRAKIGETWVAGVRAEVDGRIGSYAEDGRVAKVEVDDDTAFLAVP